MAPLINIMIGQLRPIKANYQANLERLGQVFAQLATVEPRPDVLVLPETYLTGYFLEGGVREVARPAGEVYCDLNALYLKTCGADAPALDIVIGFYERYRDHFYNSAIYATLGNGQDVASPGIRHVHRKAFLPTYALFDEARFVAEGHQIAAFETRYGRAAVLICEDAWHSISGTLAALDGAQVVYVVSASPSRGISEARPTNVEHWDELLYRIADEHGVFGVLAQLVGFEGGKGFPGGSCVIGPRGDKRVVGPLWDEALIQTTIDLDDLALARADLPLLADLETLLPHMEREIARVQRGDQVVVSWDEKIEAQPAKSAGASASARNEKTGEGAKSTFPIILAPAFDPLSDEPLRINAALVSDWLVQFLRAEVRERRGFKQVVLGLSGGVDSALVTYLCAMAFGPENVTAVRMPYKTSSSESLEHAQLVIDDLGIQSTTIDISAAVDGYLGLAPEADARRKGNVMARMRMIVLFDQSARLGCIPIGTGNKTERLFGYYTWHADDSPPVNPLGDLFKSQVWQLARHVGVPEVIVGKPASADLIRGQTDEADFGISYPKADRILAYLLQGFSAQRLVQLGFPEQEVSLVKARLDSTHWKRHLPSTAMLTSTAIGEYYLRPVDY